ncbi:MAG: glycerophosphodiester phosphodiesterase family protein [Spongiibacteraceae bacterium]
MHRDHLIAHRGWQRQFPENTLPAIQGALDAGARYVEIDVQLTTDGVPVLFHDRTLNRVCRQGGPIHHYSAAQLRQFSAYEPNRFGEKFLGTPIATLADVAVVIDRHADAHLFLEVKGLAVLECGNAAVLDAIAPYLDRLGARCTVISFAHEFLNYACSRGYQRVGPVLNHWQEIHTSRLHELEPTVVFCDVAELPAKDDLRAQPFPLAVYEVDQPEQVQVLLDRGVRWVETFAVGELLGTELA